MLIIYAILGSIIISFVGVQLELDSDLVFMLSAIYGAGLGFIMAAQRSKEVANAEDKTKKDSDKQE